MMKRALLLLAPLLLAPLLWTPGAGAQQASAWTRPAQVSVTTEPVWLPTMVAGQDRVHFLWSGAVPLSDQSAVIADVLMYRELAGTSWSSENEVVALGEGTARDLVGSAAVAGPDGRMHVLTGSSRRVAYMSAPMGEAWSAQAWSAPARLSGMETSYATALAADGGGRLHALWSELLPDDVRGEKCAQCFGLFYRQSADGRVWSTPLEISGSDRSALRPRVAADADGVIHAVWEEVSTLPGTTRSLSVGVYRRSADGGATWDAPVRLAPPRDVPQQVTLGLYANQDPVIVYRGVLSDTVYFQSSADGGATWRQPARLPGVRARTWSGEGGDAYTMATDGDGNVHLFMVGYAAGDDEPRGMPLLLHLTWNGTFWSQPEAVGTEGIVPEWPHAVISGGNVVHLTWFVSTPEGGADRRRTGVWYISRQLDAAATPLAPTFTPAPTLAPPPETSAIGAIPTPAPLPAGVAQVPPPAEGLRWEAQGLARIGGSLLVVLVALAVVTLLVRRRR